MKPKSGITCSARNPSVRRTLPDRVRSYTRPARSAVAPTWAGKPLPRGTGFPARGVGPGRTLRPPFTPFPPVKNPSVCSVCSAGGSTRHATTGDPRSPRHGLESPCHVARAFQPVGLGRAVRPPPSALRPPPSAFRPPSSVLRPPPRPQPLNPETAYTPAPADG